MPSVQHLLVNASAVLLALSAFASQKAAAAAADTDGCQRPRSEQAFVCCHSAYKVKVVSTAPLILYIQDFLTAYEREHLLAVTKHSFRRSAIAGGTGASLDSGLRTSQSAYVSASGDAIVRCIEDRAIGLQGYDVTRSQLEPLQLVRYSGRGGERYGPHTDWFTDPRYSFAHNGGNRLSSFFAYVAVSNDTTGGGTNFPLLDTPKDSRWCDDGILDCDEPYDNGLTFRPVEGNAIFWENLDPRGVGDPRTLHAGLPLASGTKVGLNIWTRQAPLSDEARGADDEMYPEL